MRGQLANLIEKQHGRVARRQLLEAGVSRDQVDRRVASGRLRVVHRGVYAVAGAPATREAIWMAAVLAGGEGAALSHRSAAELWGVLPSCSSPVHLTVAANGGRAKRTGLAVHRGRAPTTSHRGIPVTEPLRTLRDLRGRQRERAIAEAQRLRLIEASDAAALLAGEAPATNRLERRFLALVAQAGLPAPICQAQVGPYRVDFLWPAQSVIVETDGHAAHGTRIAFEEDRARDAELAARGYSVLRYTWRQLSERAGWVAGTLRAALTV